MAALLIQTALDGLLFALCALGVFGRQRGKADLALPLIYMGLCLVTRQFFDDSPGGLAFAVAPAIRLIPFLFLFLAALLLNSVWFQGREVQTLFASLGSIHTSLNEPSAPSFWIVADGSCMLPTAKAALHMQIFLYA